MGNGGTAVRGRTIPPGVDHVEFTSPRRGRIIVRVFPPDRRLADDIRRVGLAVLGTSADDAGLRHNLETGLRGWYPRLTIHEQEDLASLLPEDRTWYAMRDGRVHQPDPRIDRLHAALANARDLTEEADSALDRSRTIRTEFAEGRPARRRPAGEPAGGMDDDRDA
jgi:hypothetical protein